MTDETVSVDVETEPTDEELDLVEDEELPGAEDSDEQHPPCPSARQWDEIVEAERAIASAESDVSEKSEALKAAKKRFEARVEALRDLIHRAEQGPDLFDCTSGSTRAEPTKPDLRWRDLDVEVLAIDHGVGETIVETISEKNGIKTMGDLVDFMLAKGDFWAKDLKGIGPTKAETIADAMTAFNLKHRGDEIEPERTGDGNTPWKRQAVESLGDYGVTESSIAALSSGGIHTLGALDAQTDGGRMSSIDKICGITMAQSRVIADALTTIKDWTA